MPRAHLTLTIPEGVWIGDVSRAYPNARFRILAALADDQAGIGLAEATARELPSILAEIDGSEGITELDILQQHDNTALVQFETTMPLLLFSVQDAGVPLEMPFFIVNGEVEWELTASQHRLSELGTQLEQFDIPFAVNDIQQDVEPEQLLTERQLQRLSMTAERGYYNTLRECSLIELAAELGIAKSTCSETLYRAEGKIIKRFLAQIANAAIETENP